MFIVGLVSNRIIVPQCTESSVVVYLPVGLWYLSVNDTSLCDQVIFIVVHYNPLAVSLTLKLETICGKTMHDRCSKNVRPIF